MKKLLLHSTLALAALLFLSASSLMAQSPIKFGIKGGVNFANYNDIDDDLDARTGFLVGGFLNFALPAAPVTIQPEVLYSQKGAEQSGVEINVDYLEVPVIAKINVVPSVPVRTSVSA